MNIFPYIHANQLMSHSQIVFQTLSFLMILFNKMLQGSYRQVSIKFKDFSRISIILSYSFSRTKVNENTDLSVKILLQKCWTEIMEKLVLEN